MGLVLTTTAALCAVIVLWAINVKTFDGMLIAGAVVVIAIGVRNLLPYLPGRRD